MRDRSRVSSRHTPSPPGKDDCKSRDPDLRRFLRLLWQASPRPLAARLEPEESLPGTSETIPGCEIGEEESPGRGHGNRPGERSPPRTPLLLSATASSAEPGNPQLSKGESSRQVDFFPTPRMLLRRTPDPITGRVTATPAGAGGLLTLLITGRAGHSSGSRRRTTHTSRNRSGAVADQGATAPPPGAVGHS